MNIGCGTIGTNTYVTPLLVILDPGSIKACGFRIMGAVEVLTGELPRSDFGSYTSENLERETFGPQWLAIRKNSGSNDLIEVFTFIVDDLPNQVVVGPPCTDHVDLGVDGVME
jgi:hypothetical protein